MSCLFYLIFLFCINRSSAPPTQSHRTEATNQVTPREVVLDRGTHKRKQTSPMSAPNVPPNPAKRAAIAPTPRTEFMEDIKPIPDPRFSGPVAPASSVIPPVRTYQRASASSFNLQTPALFPSRNTQGPLRSIRPDSSLPPPTQTPMPSSTYSRQSVTLRVPITPLIAGKTNSSAAQPPQNQRQSMYVYS